MTNLVQVILSSHGLQEPGLEGLRGLLRVAPDGHWTRQLHLLPLQRHRSTQASRDTFYRMATLYRCAIYFMALIEEIDIVHDCSPFEGSSVQHLVQKGVPVRNIIHDDRQCGAARLEANEALIECVCQDSVTSNREILILDFNEHISELDGYTDANGNLMLQLAERLRLNIANLDPRCEGNLKYGTTGIDKNRKGPGLAYADDIILMAGTPRDMQALLNICATEIEKLGLRYISKKTTVLQLADVALGNETLTLSGNVLEVASLCKCLGVTLRSGGDIYGQHDEITRRTALWGFNR
ncbi:hypothetical protein HPB50_003000 [Hyalomma asiaticum]|uniref:Uncharacterized protein n=1 Tax=Hyalomma asiaticum TaxID=266040 RepID=A0ACB7T106_HYAAI|nr:hypothetical protein HPB50_003000 [Hyalomma asiaticum]